MCRYWHRPIPNRCPMKQWYTVYTKPRQEQVAKENLERQRFRTYLPLVRARKRSRGRWVCAIEPFFPCYLFVHVDLEVDNTATIRSTRGVISLVRFGTVLAPVQESLIEMLQDTADPETGMYDLGQPVFKRSDRVTVMDGPFMNLTGIFQGADTKQRVAVLLEILGGQRTVAFAHDQLALAGA